MFGGQRAWIPVIWVQCVASHEQDDKEWNCCWLEVSRTLTGLGPSEVAALPSRWHERLGELPDSTIECRASRPDHRLHSLPLCKDSHFWTIHLAGLLEIAFVTLDRDHGAGLRVVKIEMAAGRAQLITVFFLSASLLYMAWNLLFPQVSAVWLSLRKTCHFVTLASVRTSSWTLTASHHEWRSEWFSEALLLRKKAGSWFAVSGCDGTLKLIFRKGPLTPRQITRFSAPDNAGRLSSTERTWSKFALLSSGWQTYPSEKRALCIEHNASSFLWLLFYNPGSSIYWLYDLGKLLNLCVLQFPHR